MQHEDQREFYSCPLCGAGTGNDIDNAIHGSPEHDCPVEKEMRLEHKKENISCSHDKHITMELFRARNPNWSKFSIELFAINNSTCPYCGEDVFTKLRLIRKI